MFFVCPFVSKITETVHTDFDECLQEFCDRLSWPQKEMRSDMSAA